LSEEYLPTKWAMFMFFGYSCAATLLMVGNFIFYTVLGEVNGRSPADRQISMWFVNTKMFFVLERHRELFPESRKRGLMRWCVAVGLLLFVATTFAGVVHYSK